jgi:acetyl esterase
VISLDPQAQALLDAAASVPPLYSLPIDEARARMRASFVTDDVIPIASMSEHVIPGPASDIAARLYLPRTDVRLPVILYLHGGGWTVDDLDTHDLLCALLAGGADAAVLSVDYRMSPENKYPAALDDAYAALSWLADNTGSLGVEPVIGIAGDSAGAALAAACTLIARDRGAPAITAQLLLYPVTDYLEPGSESYHSRGTGYSLDRAFMAWAFENYLPDEWSRDDPCLFPLRAVDLAGLPPASIVTAEFDPLRDEGVAYATRLSEASVPVRHWHAADQMHGFAMQTRAIRNARRLFGRIAMEFGVRLRSS